MNHLAKDDFRSMLTAVADMQAWQLSGESTEMILTAAAAIDSEDALNIFDQFSAADSYTKPGQLLAKLRDRAKGLEPLPKPAPMPEPTLCEEFVRFCRANRQRAQGTYPTKATCKGTCDRVDILPCNQDSRFQPKMCSCVQKAWDAPLTAKDWAIARSGGKVTKPPGELLPSF